MSVGLIHVSVHPLCHKLESLLAQAQTSVRCLPRLQRQTGKQVWSAQAQVGPGGWHSHRPYWQQCCNPDTYAMSSPSTFTSVSSLRRLRGSALPARWIIMSKGSRGKLQAEPVLRTCLVLAQDPLQNQQWRLARQKPKPFLALCPFLVPLSRAKL